jgi:hypothetical protein
MKKGWKIQKTIKKLSLMTNLPGIRILFWGDKNFYKTGKNPPLIEKKEGSEVNVSHNDVVPYKNYTFGYADDTAYYFYNKRLLTDKDSRGNWIAGEDEELKKAYGESKVKDFDYNNIFKDDFYDWKEGISKKNKDYMHDKIHKIANYNFIVEEKGYFAKKAREIINNIVGNLEKFNKLTLGVNGYEDAITEYIPLVKTDISRALETQIGLTNFKKDVLRTTPKDGENDSDAIKVNKTFTDRLGKETASDKDIANFNKEQQAMKNLLTSTAGGVTSVQSLINDLEKLQKIKLHKINNLIRLAKKFRIHGEPGPGRNYIKILSEGVGSNFKINNEGYQLYHYAGGYSHVPGAAKGKAGRIAEAKKPLTKIIKGWDKSGNTYYHDTGDDGELLLRNNDNNADFSKTYNYYNFVKTGYTVFQYKDKEASKLHEDTCYKLNDDGSGTYDVYDYDADFFDENGLPNITKNSTNKWVLEKLTKLKAEDPFFIWGDHPYKGFETYNNGKPNEHGGLNNLILDKDFKSTDLILSEAKGGSVAYIKDQKFIFQNQLEKMKGSFHASYSIYYVSVWISMLGYVIVTGFQGGNVGELFKRLSTFLIANALETGMVLYSHRKYIQKSEDAANIEDVTKTSPVYSYAVGAYATRIATVVGFLSYILTHAKEG